MNVLYSYKELFFPWFDEVGSGLEERGQATLLSGLVGTLNSLKNWRVLLIS